MKYQLMKMMSVAIVAAGVTASVLARPAAADDRDDHAKGVIELPQVKGWYDGKEVLYVTTDVSDPGLASASGANYVPLLANVLTATSPGVDDIYAVTNFAQSNIVPSAPLPAGPGNSSASYSPLWQVSTVTWANPGHATTLKSESDVLAAEAAHLVTVTKTSIVVNCPMIYTPQGGLLPGARIERR